MRKPKTPTFTLQVKVTAVIDVEVEAATIEQALEIGKTTRLGDVVAYEDGVIENDHKVEVIGVLSNQDWGTN
jgi:hypothetical protein